MRGWGLTDTKEGRLAVIAVVAGTLMILVAVGNLVAADVADDDADRVRAALRQELARLPDEVVVGYPATRGAVEDAAGAALGPRRGRVLGSAADHDGHVTVAVQSGFAWQVRCVEAHLRGRATVLTYVHHRPC